MKFPEQMTPQRGVGDPSWSWVVVVPVSVEYVLYK
jgi:hypothetical protein